MEAKAYLGWTLNGFGINKTFDGKKLHEITTKETEKYQGSGSEKVKPAFINREIALLKRMFTKTVEWGKLNDSPAKKAEPLKADVQRVRFLTVDEIQRLVSNCSEHLEPIVM